MNDPNRRPWDKRPDETAKSFAAFVQYIELGPSERSFGRLATVLGKSAGYTRWIEEWSSRFDWVARASAFDEHIAAKALERAEQTRVAAWVRLAMAGEQAASTLIAGMRGILPEANLDGDLIELILGLDSDDPKAREKAEARYVASQNRLKAAESVLNRIGVESKTKIEFEDDRSGKHDADEIPYDRRVAALRALAGETG